MTAIKPYVPRAVNRVPDPTLESGIGGAQATSNATLYPLAYDTSVKHSGTRSLWITRAASSPSAVLASMYVTPTGYTNMVVVKVTPGEVISCGAWVRSTVSPFQARITLYWRDTANVTLDGTVVGPLFFNLPGNTWTFVTAENITVPAGTAAMTMFNVATLLPSGLTVGGEQSWIDDAILVSGPTCPAYFDGNTPGCSWSGTPHQSQSVRAVVTPWTRWDGAAEQPLDVAGLWDGTALQPVDLRDVTVV